MTKEDRWLVVIIYGTPFLMTAAIHFLPWWLSMPCVFVLFLVILGAFIQLMEGKE